MLPIRYPALLAGALLFFIASGMMWRFFRQGETSFGEFSVGFTHRDLYAFLVLVVPMIAGTSYLMMSLGLGKVVIDGRAFFWLRYFEWSVTTPLLVLGVVMLTQAGRLTADTMLLDYLMIVTGFLAAVLAMPWKLVAFGLSSLAYLGLIYLLFRTAEDEIDSRPERTRGLFRRLRILLMGLWTAYPLLWLVSTDGFGLIGFELSMRLFMVLDLCAKIGFAYMVAHSFDSVGDLDIELSFED